MRRDTFVAGTVLVHTVQLTLRSCSLNEPFVRMVEPFNQIVFELSGPRSSDPRVSAQSAEVSSSSSEPEKTALTSVSSALDERTSMQFKKKNKNKNKEKHRGSGSSRVVQGSGQFQLQAQLRPVSGFCLTFPPGLPGWRS